MQTKWSILHARALKLEQQAREIREELVGLNRTPLNIPCSGCGENLATEGDFARHFENHDERYLNMGSCPKRTTEQDLPTLDATRTSLAKYR